MESSGRRRRALVAGGVVVALALAVGALLLPQRIERRVEALAVREAAARGVALRVGRVRFAWLGPLRLERVAFEERGVSGRARLVSVAWRPSRRLSGWMRALRLEGFSVRAGEIEVELADSTWDLLHLARDRISIRQRRGTESLLVSWQAGGRAEARLDGYELDALAHVTRAGVSLVKMGRVSGRVAVRPLEGGDVEFDVLTLARGVRLSSLSAAEDAAAPAEFGAPMDLELAASGSLSPARGRADVACWRLTTSGLEMSGAGAIEAGAGDVWADVALDVPRFELGPIVAASGLSLDVTRRPLPEDLGSASLTAELKGHLRDPDSIEVDQHLVFHRPAHGIPALAYLNGPFTHVVERPDCDVAISVSPASADFVALDEVPPLFIRALTIAEDAGFWGHPGIDLSEIPIALATNWNRGEKARGGSTITQQLVKNLFLSRRKSYGRKLQEAALSLLVESVVSKRRILEIYLNVIEWGPDLYGLRPAAHRYFGKEPAELTPKEMAFLVALIPGPIKYQRSFADGVLTPRFGQLVTGLLAKLRSVDALGEEEYQNALAQPLAFTFGRGAPVPVPAEDASPPTGGPASADETQNRGGGGPPAKM